MWEIVQRESIEIFIMQSDRFNSVVREEGVKWLWLQAWVIWRTEDQLTNKIEPECVIQGRDKEEGSRMLHM